MIEPGNLRLWAQHALWPDPAQVEQDLVLSRALVELFRKETISQACTLRGGTALNKLIFKPAARYSEDIDLVQEVSGPIGPLLDAVREAISPWLGRPKVERLTRGTTLIWRFETSTNPIQVSRLKLEINTREHCWVGKPEKVAFVVDNPWFSGEAAVTTVALKDLLATKMRALYQRRKGRDLFDLHVALERFPDLDLSHILTGFRMVMNREGHPVSWKVFEINVQNKVDHPAFAADIKSLLAKGEFDPVTAWSSLGPRLQTAWGTV